MVIPVKRGSGKGCMRTEVHHAVTHNDSFQLDSLLKLAEKPMSLKRPTQQTAAEYELYKYKRGTSNVSVYFHP